MVFLSDKRFPGSRIRYGFHKCMTRVGQFVGIPGSSKFGFLESFKELFALEPKAPSKGSRYINWKKRLFGDASSAWKNFTPKIREGSVIYSDMIGVLKVVKTE